MSELSEDLIARLRIGFDVDLTESVLFEAADRIEELESMVIEWISVKDRLPEHGVWVLGCYMPKGGMVVVRLSRSESMPFWDDTQHYRDITHWMPLPAPPTDKARESN